MTMRKAEPRDLVTVSDITRRAYQGWVPIVGGEPMPMADDYSVRIADGEVWLLEEAGAVTGLIVLEDHEDSLVVYSVAVAPEHQHGGRGQKLLAFAEDEARRRGRNTMKLFTNVRMVRNIGIYRRFGYVETRRSEHPTRAGWIRVDMEKRLGRTANRRHA